MNTYAPLSDMSVFVICPVLLLLLKTTYIPNTKRYTYVKLAIFNLMYICITSVVLNNYLIPNLNKNNTFWTYFFHNALYISLINELGLYFFYILDLVNSKNNKIKQAILIAIFVFAILELTSNWTQIGFYIRDGIIYQEKAIDLYLLWYIGFLTAMLVTILRKNKLMISRIYFAVFIVFIIAIIISVSGLHAQTQSFITLSYLIPIIMVIVLFHSNSYNTNYGALDRTALASRIYELKKEKEDFAFVYITITDFDLIEDKPGTAEDFKMFTKKIKYSDYLFRCSDNGFAMLFQNQPNIEKIGTLFLQLHKKYCLTHKIIVIDPNQYCNTLEDYLDLCNLTLNRIPSNTYYKITETDLSRFYKTNYIKKELKDIELKHDLNDPRVKVYCQPILNIQSKRFSSAESLMRLQTDELGMIFPDMFIPIAENEGMIHTLTMIILNKVCQYLEMYENIDRISVNFSMCEITQPSFLDDIKSILNAYNFNNDRLGFEITESMEADNFYIIKNVLSEIRNLGIKIYLDDFGTGYSNFDHITKLPLDIIKFDRSLVISSASNDNSFYMVGSLSKMLSEIGYNILYEGIEDRQDQDRCIQMQAKYLQGYRYSKPIPIDTLQHFLDDNQIVKDIEIVKE